MGLFGGGSSSDQNLERRVADLERTVLQLNVQVAALSRGTTVTDAPIGYAPASGGGYVPSDRVGELVGRDELIQAIKQVRQETGWGLKEAKDFVDRMTGRR